MIFKIMDKRNTNYGTCRGKKKPQGKSGAIFFLSKWNAG